MEIDELGTAAENASEDPELVQLHRERDSTVDESRPRPGHSGAQLTISGLRKRGISGNGTLAMLYAGSGGPSWSIPYSECRVLASQAA